MTVGALVLASNAPALAGSQQSDDPLARRIDVVWRDVPLSQAAHRLAQVVEVTAFIDRRLDPHARVTLRANGVSARDAFLQLAQQVEAVIVDRAELVYLGPSEGAATLVAAPPLGSAPRATQRLLKRKKKIVWNRLAMPREIIEQALAEERITIENANLVPHDLWDAGTLPTAPVADQLSVLLTGFGLTWHADPQRTGVVVLELSNATAQPIAPRLTPRETPPAGVPSAVAVEQQRYTLRVQEQPLEAVLGQIAERSGMELRITPGAAPIAAQRTSFSVREASLDELLEAAAASAGLVVRRIESIIEVTTVR
ncbi:hypothetical protein Pla111_02600 [Botrimarina hoheduenensis]|uniref:Secretin/TonB short N-terminal domain-containing protein n=2 Tax=Botrimarina hoheduenensis TaxID=2528000 RepID=A0A5C5WEJ3_9BACT|nr:hypothetical protein Pla111_02600 [Botrimarina hoheduenensis]